MKNFQQTPKQRTRELRAKVQKAKAQLAHSNPKKTFENGSWGYTNKVLDHGGKL